jgi:hypothetical protein
MANRWLSLLLAPPLALVFAGCPEETEPPPGDALAPPPKGEGFQFATGEQPVGPGEEVQNCYFFQVKDLMQKGGLDASKPLNLHQVQIHQTEGSHHMNLFRVRTINTAEDGLDPAKGPYLNKGGTGPCFKSTNWADWPLIANTQIDGQLDWTFPDGVVNKLDPEEWIMLQSHYVNASTQETPDGAGEVFINFWHLPDSDVIHEMGTLFATKQSIRVCQSNPSPSYSGSCQLTKPESGQELTVVGANAHFHSRGKQFQMFSWDGVSTTQPDDSAKFYTSEAWDEPPMERGDSLAKVVPGGGVFYTCSYQWTEPPAEIGCAGLDEFDRTVKGTAEEQLDCCYTFGPVVDRNEHCNIFVYYYPKSEDVACF